MNTNAFPVSKHNLLPHVILYFAILGCFQLSSLFVVDPLDFQVVSFVSAVMTVGFLKYRWRVLPTIAAALFSYYFFSGRDGFTSLVFSLTIPLLPLFVAIAFHCACQRQKSIRPYDHMVTFFLFYGLTFPILNALKLLLLSSLVDDLYVSTQFLFYSSISSALTQLLLTPIILFIIYALSRNETHRYVLLDNELRASYRHTWSFFIWFASCATLITIALSYKEPLILITICLVVFLIATTGIGKHGVLRPLGIGAGVILLMVYAGVQRANETGIEDSFYGLMMMLMLITALSYLIAGYVLQHHEMLKTQIRAERIDPYTGLFNVKQLEEDITEHQHIVLIYLDLAPTLSKLGDIGHEGKSQLIGQVQKELLESDSIIKRCYRPPYTLGILGFMVDGSEVEEELCHLTGMLKDFQFYWKGTSISLVDPILHCINATHSQNIHNLVSHLCGQPHIADTLLHWVDEPAIEGKVDKLSYIQKAFKNDWFELNCQPYLKLAASLEERLHSFEVLLRINPENGVRLTPAEFFPLVNQFGLETQLDKWVVHNTFKMLHEQVHEWDKIEKCAINLTAKSLGVSHLAHDILASAKMFEIPLKRICFEITESSALQNEQQAIQTITILRNAGCKIALDDFGTGYASFAYLRRLPLDILKVDGEFVKELPTNESDRLIVSSISKVAKEIGLETVAEFVESHEHIEILNSLGITYAQGYGVAKPRPLIHYLHEINEKEALAY